MIPPPPDPEELINARRLMNPALLLELIPHDLGEALHHAMVDCRACDDAAGNAVETTKRAIADWIFSGGHRYDAFEHTAEAVQKLQLQRVAREAIALLAALRELSLEADVRLSAYLPNERQGPWSGLAALAWNPDSIEIEASPQGLLSYAAEDPPQTVLLPANLAAKLERFRRDLIELAPALQRASAFTPRKRGNEPLQHLYRQCIDAWALATNEWPTAGLRASYDDDLEGLEALGRKANPSTKATANKSSAASPIPATLRAMAISILGAAPPCMNDAAFLRALETQRKLGFVRTGRRTLFGRTRAISAPPRGRSKRRHNSSSD